MLQMIITMMMARMYAIPAEVLPHEDGLAAMTITGEVYDHEGFDYYCEGDEVILWMYDNRTSDDPTDDEIFTVVGWGDVVDAYMVTYVKGVNC